MVVCNKFSVHCPNIPEHVCIPTLLHTDMDYFRAFGIEHTYVSCPFTADNRIEA